MNAVSAKSYQKKEAISKYVPKQDMGIFINAVRNFPIIYAILSNLISPLFIITIKFRRKYIGR
jgi:hypothetical protein